MRIGRKTIFHSPEELKIVFDACPNAIVMIDDFQVPFDAGYGYDNYGVDRVLTADYVVKPIVAGGLRVLYPSTPSVNETGARRGCVVLAQNTTIARALTCLPLLREEVPG